MNEWGIYNRAQETNFVTLHTISSSPVIDTWTSSFTGFLFFLCHSIPILLIGCPLKFSWLSWKIYIGLFYLLSPWVFTSLLLFLLHFSRFPVCLHRLFATIVSSPLNGSSLPNASEFHLYQFSCRLFLSILISSSRYLSYFSFFSSYYQTFFFISLV